MGAWISFIATIETYMKMQLSKLKLAAMASHNQVNKKDFSNSKTQPKGRGGHKGKNLNRLANLNLRAWDVVKATTQGNLTMIKISS